MAYVTLEQELYKPPYSLPGTLFLLLGSQSEDDMVEPRPTHDEHATWVKNKTFIIVRH